MKDLSALRGAAVNGRIRMQTQNDCLGPVSPHMAPSLKWEGEGRWEREKDKVARSVKQPRMSGTQSKPCFTELHMQLPRALNCDQRKQSNRMKLVPDMRVCSGNSKLTVIYIDIQPLEQITHRLGLVLIFQYITPLIEWTREITLMTWGSNITVPKNSYVLLHF